LPLCSGYVGFTLGDNERLFLVDVILSTLVIVKQIVIRENKNPRLRLSVYNIGDDSGKTTLAD